MLVPQPAARRGRLSFALVALLLTLGAGLVWKRAEPTRSALPTQRAKAEDARALVDARTTSQAQAAEAAPQQRALHRAAAQAPQPLSDQLREHALGMLSLNLLHAVESGDEQEAKWLRNQLDDPRLQSAVALNDLETLELAIDCLGHQSDARDEARDLLEFAPPSLLSDALRWACE